MDDVLQGNWKQLKGELKIWWGKLTDDDITQIEGHQDKLVGALQTRYGYTKERAQSEVNQRLKEYEKGLAGANR